jgi:hypothetical protein
MGRGAVKRRQEETRTRRRAARLNPDSEFKESEPELEASGASHGMFIFTK